MPKKSICMYTVCVKWFRFKVFNTINESKILKYIWFYKTRIISKCYFAWFMQKSDGLPECGLPTYNTNVKNLCVGRSLQIQKCISYELPSYCSKPTLEPFIANCVSYIEKGGETIEKMLTYSGLFCDFFSF